MINYYYYYYYYYYCLVALLLLLSEFSDCTCIYSFQCVAVTSSGVFTAFLIGLLHYYFRIPRTRKYKPKQVCTPLLS